jgi:hypothetical protein
MTPVMNPHDKLFRETWRGPATVRSFLQHYLPAETRALTDLDMLEI